MWVPIHVEPNQTLTLIVDFYVDPSRRCSKGPRVEIQLKGGAGRARHAEFQLGHGAFQAAPVDTRLGLIRRRLTRRPAFHQSEVGSIRVKWYSLHTLDDLRRRSQSDEIDEILSCRIACGKRAQPQANKQQQKRRLQMESTLGAGCGRVRLIPVAVLATTSLLFLSDPSGIHFKKIFVEVKPEF